MGESNVSGLLSEPKPTTISNETETLKEKEPNTIKFGKQAETKVTSSLFPGKPAFLETAQ